MEKFYYKTTCSAENFADLEWRKKIYQHLMDRAFNKHNQEIKILEENYFTLIKDGKELIEPYIIYTL